MRSPGWRLPGVAIAGIAVIVTAACSVASSSADGETTSTGAIEPLPDDANVSIVFESYNYGSAGPWADTFTALIDTFEQEHPQIDVVPQKPQGSSPNPASDTVSSIQAQIAAGSPPDVTQLGFSDLDFTVNQLGAANLETLVGEAQVDELFNGGAHPYVDAVAELGTWDGATYGVPFVLSTPVLYYNASLFEAAGLDPDSPPSTWDEVAEAAAQIATATGKGGVYVDCLTKSAKDWCFQSLVRSNGGTVISDDRTALTFASDAAIEVASEMQQLVSDGAFPNLAQMQAVEAFAAGELGMILESSSVQETFVKGAAGAWDLRSTTMPSFGSTPAVPTNSGAALYIFSEDPLKQAASWELVKFLTSAPAAAAITQGIGYLPLREGLIESDAELKAWYDENPLAAPNLEQLPYIEPWVSMPGNSYLQIRDQMMEAVENIVFSGAAPKQTLESAATEATELMP